MAGQWPMSPGFESLGFQSNEKNVADDATDGSQKVRGMGGQWWSWSVRYRSLRAAAFRPIKSFMTRQGGRRETFTMILPDISYQSGDASGPVTVAGAQAIGENMIPVGPFGGTLVDADHIKFDGHDKVYMVVGDTTAPGPGDGTLEIYPPLVKAVADLEPIVYDAVPFLCRLESDEQEFGIRNDSRREYEVDVKEAI